jgi:WD40 repeat protein
MENIWFESEYLCPIFLINLFCGHQASGSDDKYIFVYRFNSTPAAYGAFGSSKSNAKNKENWSRWYTLQGHSMDVLDLDWSKGSNSTALLVSASVDNTICVWDLDLHQKLQNSIFNNSASKYAPSILSPTRVLSGHQSFVKGKNIITVVETNKRLR